MTLDAFGAVAADLGVPRRHGRRLGALRGLGEDADRQGRHRPRLRLRQVVARRHPPGADPPARPVLRSARCGSTRCRSAALQARAGLDAGTFTEEQMAEVVAASRRNAQGQPLRPAAVATPTAEALLKRARLRGAAAQARLPADHRRRRGRDPRRRRRGPRAQRPAGVDPGHRPPHRGRTRSACATSPTRCRPRRRRPRPASADGKVDVAELHAPFTPPGADPARSALGLGDDVSDQPVGRRAVRQPDHGGRPHPHRRGRHPHHQRRGRPGRRPTPPRVPCLQQNLVCVLEGE